MPKIEVTNFQNGVTLDPIVNQGDPRVMETIDGFWIDKKSAVPRGGTSKLLTGSTFVLDDMVHASYLGRFGGYPWLVGVDSSSLMRFARLGYDSAWSTAVNDLAFSTN